MEPEKRFEPEVPGRLSDTHFGLMLLIAAVLIGAWLRLATLPWLSLFADELWTLKWSQQPISSILDSIKEGRTMPLYLIFMNWWASCFGTSALAMKFPSLVAGICLVPLIYILGRRWLGPQPAAVAAMLAAVNPYLIAQSRVARAYPILCLVILLSMYFFFQALRRIGGRDLLWLCLMNATAIALSLNAVYILIVQFLGVVMQRFFQPRLSWSQMSRIGFALAISLIISLPFHIKMLASILDASGRFSGHRIRAVLLLEVWQIHHKILPAVAFLALLLGAWSILRGQYLAGRLLGLWFFIPPIFYLAQKTTYPASDIARYLASALPAAFLFSAAGIVFLLRLALRGAALRWSIVAVLLSVFAGTFLDTRARAVIFKDVPPTGPAIKRISSLVQPGDVVTGKLLFTLIESQKGLNSAALAKIIRDPDMEEPGRLVILTMGPRRAVEWWSQSFSVEEVRTPRNRGRLYILISGRLPGGESSLKDPVRNYMLGYVRAAADGARLHGSVRARHFRELAAVHGALARLSDSEEERARHYSLRDRYQRWREEAYADSGVR